MDDSPNSEPRRSHRRITVALLLRITYWDAQKKPITETACTYDISAGGARITGLRGIKNAGDVIAIERGRTKTFCRVVWVGDAGSKFRGQMGVQCAEGECQMWQAELRELAGAQEPSALPQSVTTRAAAAG